MISLTSPVETRAHTWPAGLKLALLCLSTAGLFFLDRLSAHVLVLITIIGLYSAPGWLFLRYGLSRLWVLWPFISIIVVWHLSTGAYAEGAVIALRMVSAVALANLVTMTTKMIDIIEVIRRLAQPLRRVGLNSRPLEIAIALVIRLIPVLMEKSHAIVESWQARANRKVSWKVVMPIALIALDDADHVADALKARGGLHVQK